MFNVTSITLESEDGKIKAVFSKAEGTKLSFAPDTDLSFAQSAMQQLETEIQRVGTIIDVQNAKAMQ